MSNIESLLFSFAMDPENPEKNYYLARSYQDIGQTAAAISYYLRAAERSDNKELSYECILQAGNCFQKQGNRDKTVIDLYKMAISILPERSEAYLCLSRFYEWSKNYRDAYLYSEMGLKTCNFEGASLRTNVHEPIFSADYGLLFEKAVSAYWIGRSQESKDIFRYLRKNYDKPIDPIHINSIHNNISILAAGQVSAPISKYNKEFESLLRFKFTGSENIQENYSQAFQDLFVLSMLNGKRNGTYLEIGSSDPHHMNNTFLLEKEFDWKGIGIEIKESDVSNYRIHRKNKILHEDALNVNYDEILSEIAINGSVDYLQLDCEPPSTTFEIMTKIPFDKYKFAVITFEHDHYIDDKNFREKSRSFLESKGYVLIVNDIASIDTYNFEDWWVHPDLIEPNIIELMKDSNPEYTNVFQYMFDEKKSINMIKSNNFSLNYKSNKRLFVVDDFYEDPTSVRNFALVQDYDINGLGRGYVGNRTINQFLFDGLKEKFEQIMQVKITKWEEYEMNGRFQVAKAGEPLVYHCDSQKWAGMIYLTPDAPFETGTTMYAHKNTRIRHSSHPKIMSTFRKESTLDKTFYEPVDVIGNVFNRLVIFDAGLIHAASEYFGFNNDNCRLWQMFFFDAEEISDIANIPEKKQETNKLLSCNENKIKNNLKTNLTYNVITIPDNKERVSHTVGRLIDNGAKQIEIHVKDKYDEIKDQIKSNVLLTPPVATVISHLKAIKYWLETTKEEYGIFLEDDTYVDNSKFWNFTIEDIIDKIPEDCDALQMCAIYIDGQEISSSLQIREWNTWGAQAYILKRSYARKIIDYYVKDNYFNLIVPSNETSLIQPCVEHVLFINQGKVYTFPFFHEDNARFKSGYVNNFNHLVSAFKISDWWSSIGTNKTLSDIMTLK